MANKLVATASLTIGFSVDSSSDGSFAFQVEVDGREDGLNGGKTSFRPGDNVFLLLYHPPLAVVEHALTTQGSLVKGENFTIPVTEFVTFGNQDNASLSKPAVALPTVNWMGESLGNVVLEGNGSSLRLTTVPDPKDGPYVGVAEVTYNTYVTSYQLTGTLIPDKDEYSILNYFVGSLQV